MITKKNFTILLVYTIITILIFYRGSCFLLEGTFDADEFSFYKNAKENGIINGLFFVYEPASYFKLWTNIANSFASLFSFEKAKIITNFFSVFIYYIIFSYILFFKSELFKSIKQKIFGICIILFSPGMTPEVWMGSAHIREYFGIFAFLMLFYDSRDDTKFKKIISYFLIVISFLSSIWASVLSPVYFLKYFFRKTKDNLNFFLLSFFCSLIQFIIVFNHLLLKSLETTGRFQIGPEKIFSFIYNVPVRSFFGSTIPKILFIETGIYQIENFNYFIYLITILVSIFFVIYILKKKDFLLNLIFVSFILISVFAIFGSLTPNFVGGRYAVISCVILTFLVFRMYILEGTLVLKICFGVLLFFSLLIGIIEYKFKSPLPEFLACKVYFIESEY